MRDVWGLIETKICISSHGRVYEEKCGGGVCLCIQNTKLGDLLNMSVLQYCDLTGISRGIPDLHRPKKTTDLGLCITQMLTNLLMYIYTQI